jgi:hypothetical protein
MLMTAPNMRTSKNSSHIHSLPVFASTFAPLPARSLLRSARRQELTVLHADLEVCPRAVFI